MRGLKIHQARMKCQVESSQTQHAGIPPDETQEVSDREVDHSARSLQAEAQDSPGTPKIFGKKIK